MPRSYLYRLRWPEGFVCPRCQGREAWENCRNLWVCRSADITPASQPAPCSKTPISHCAFGF